MKTQIEIEKMLEDLQYVQQRNAKFPNDFMWNDADRSRIAGKIDILQDVLEISEEAKSYYGQLYFEKQKEKL